jgi:hypothetical protein
LAERETAIEVLKRQARKRIRPRTLDADKGYETRDYVSQCRSRRLTPHVAASTERRGGSAIDGRTTRHAGYAVSQRLRKRVEEILGWSKTVDGMRRNRFKGRERNAALRADRRHRLQPDEDCENPQRTSGGMKYPQKEPRQPAAKNQSGWALAVLAIAPAPKFC